MKPSGNRSFPDKHYRDLLPVVKIAGDRSRARCGPSAEDCATAIWPTRRQRRDRREPVAAVPLGLARPRAILFDWDNTLVDSWTTIHEALNVVMVAMGKPSWSLQETRSASGSAYARVSDSFRRTMGGGPPDLSRRISRIHLERLNSPAWSRRIAASALRRRHFLGVVSNKTGSLLRREVDRIGWSIFFGSVIGAGDAASTAGCRSVVLAQSSGIKARDVVWFVGDTGVDMECRAKAARPVLLGSG
jgi:phosphoglycolate phosphatase